MSARMLAILLGGIGAVVVAGCSDSNDGAGSTDQFISELCAEISPCCASKGLPADGAQCRAFYGAFVGQAGYDEAAADACLAEFRAREDVCDLSSKAVPSCGKVFSNAGGTKQPGEACDSDSDCASPSEGEVECASDFVDGANVQQCQVRLPGRAGSAPCIGTVDGNVTFYSGVQEGIPPTGYLCDLADGLSCDGQTGACEKLAEVGEPCSGECVRSAYCAFAEGVCKERLAIGTPCASSAECAESAYCDSATGTCIAQLGTGAACESSSECSSQNCTNQKCAASGLNDLSTAFLCGSN